MTLSNKPISEIVYIKNKPLEYFIQSDKWDAELTESGHSFRFLYTSEKYDPDDDYNAGSIIPYEITLKGIKPAERYKNKIGYWEHHQDNRWYFEDYHEDMIEKIYEKDTHLEFYL